jgi:hypothetical protein
LENIFNVHYNNIYPICIFTITSDPMTRSALLTFVHQGIDNSLLNTQQTIYGIYLISTQQFCHTTKVYHTTCTYRMIQWSKFSVCEMSCPYCSILLRIFLLHLLIGSVVELSAPVGNLVSLAISSIIKSVLVRGEGTGKIFRTWVECLNQAAYRQNGIVCKTQCSN